MIKHVIYINDSSKVFSFDSDQIGPRIVYTAVTIHSRIFVFLHITAVTLKAIAAKHGER